MLGIILISQKNGRSGKTYGVKSTPKYNMKFSFLCLVTIISCSVCASGDLDIFPGYRFGLTPEEYRRRLARSNGEPLYRDSYNRWPTWRSAHLDDYGESRQKERDFDFELPKRLRHIEDHDPIIKDEEFPYYYPNTPQQLEKAYEEYKNFEEKANEYNQYPYQFPSSPILSDVRPYPQDDDFTFHDEENEDAEESESQSISSYDEGVSSHTSQFSSKESLEEVKDVPQKSPAPHDNKVESSEGSSKKQALKDAKLVEDPTEFAYAPPDPRFYETPTNNDELLQPKPSLTSKPKKDQADVSIENNVLNDNALLQSTFAKAQTSRGRGRDADVEMIHIKPQEPEVEAVSIYIIAIVAGVSAAAAAALIAVGVGWYRLQKHVKNASDVEYPAYGITGPNKDVSPSGDRKLAQSAQMYHYQHQKQQIIAMESRQSGAERHNSNSDPDSDEENEEGDYTVYECPGLAPTGEMEVKNPMFQDDQTPVEAPQVKIGEEEKK